MPKPVKLGPGREASRNAEVAKFSAEWIIVGLVVGVLALVAFRKRSKQ